MKENDFITITNIKEYIEIGMIKIGEVLHLKKEPDNAYDMESIMVENKNEIPIGHVANSVSSVAKGTHSAGYIYQSFKDSILCTVKFIYRDMIIAQLQTSQEETKKHARLAACFFTFYIFYLMIWNTYLHVYYSYW